MSSDSVTNGSNGSSRKLGTLFKQRKIGMLLGVIKIIVGNISPYASWVSLALIGITSFYTTVSPVFQEHGMVFPFWLFCVLIVLVLLGMALLEWVFMMPSFYRANNYQSWDAGGPLQDKVNKMEKDLEEIRKLLELKKENKGEIKK